MEISGIKGIKNIIKSTPTLAHAHAASIMQNHDENDNNIDNNIDKRTYNWFLQLIHALSWDSSRSIKRLSTLFDFALFVFR